MRKTGDAIIANDIENEEEQKRLQEEKQKRIEQEEKERIEKAEDERKEEKEEAERLEKIRKQLEKEQRRKEQDERKQTKTINKRNKETLLITVVIKVWNDPVWSKVIAATIISVGALIYTYVKSIFDELSFEETLQNYWVGIVTISLAFLGIFFTWKKNTRRVGIIILLLAMFIFLVERNVYSHNPCLNIDEMIMNADSSFVQGKYDSAITKYKEILTCDTSVSTKLNQAQNCLAFKTETDEFFKNKKYEQAKTEYQKIFEINQKDTYVEKQISECEREIINKMMVSADSAFVLGQYDVAIPKYDEVLACAEAALNSRQFRDTLVSRKLKQSENCLEFKTAADEFFKNKKYERAKTEYQKIFEINPKDTYSEEQIRKIEQIRIKARDWNGKGNVENYERRNYQQAIIYYKNAIDIDPEYQAAYFNIALAYTSIGDYENVIINAQKAIEYNRQSGNSYRVLGYAYLNRRENENAFNAFSKAIELPNAPYVDKYESSENEKRAESYYGRARANYNLGKYKEALDDINQAIRLDPQDKDYKNYKERIEFSLSH